MSEAFDQWLPVKLTEDEVKERGRELAEIVHRVLEAQAEKKQAMADFKEQLEKFHSEEQVLGQAIRQRQEMRMVSCRLHVSGADASTVRMDTGEIVSTRPATEEERQANLFDPQVDDDQ